MKTVNNRLVPHLAPHNALSLLVSRSPSLHGDFEEIVERLFEVRLDSACHLQLEFVSPAVRN